MLLKALFFLLLAFSLVPGMTAQTTNASCLPFYGWTDNSRKQSPCQVASVLIGTCTPSYVVAALPNGTHYLGPSLDLATPCQCNTVVYSLMSACGACQGRNYESWSEWTTNCAAVSVGSFPEISPLQTFVPAWAYLDVETNDRFNETAARLAVNATEHSEPLPSSAYSPTVSVKTSTSISSAGPPTQPTLANVNPSTSSTNTSLGPDSRLDTIVGGVVGGVLGLALIGTVAIWLILRHRERRVKTGNPLPSSSQGNGTSNGPEAGATSAMSWYLANTAPEIVAPSVTTTSLPSPTSVKFSESNPSIKSIRRSNV